MAAQNLRGFPHHGRQAEQPGPRVRQKLHQQTDVAAGRNSPRTAEPKTDNSLTPYRRQIAAISHSGKSIPEAVVMDAFPPRLSNVRDRASPLTAAFVSPCRGAKAEPCSRWPAPKLASK
jgi:hypothetical protein